MLEFWQGIVSTTDFTFILEIRLPQNLAKVDLVIHGLFVT